MKKSSEPYVKLEKLDEDQIKKLVKKENEDYFDSLLNDFGEEEDDLDDSPQLDAKTGEFKTKEKEDNDIEILQEVVNVQRPKKELQLVKLVKIAPKPEVSVKKVKLDPSTGLFQDESGQETQGHHRLLQNHLKLGEGLVRSFHLLRKLAIFSYEKQLIS